MGLINNDLFESNNGIQKSGTYIAFANETIYLRKYYPMSDAYAYPSPTQNTGQNTDQNTDQKQEQLYNINANYRIYWDKTARESGKSFIDTRSINTRIKESQLCLNLYEVLYDLLRQQYPNSINS